MARERLRKEWRPVKGYEGVYEVSNKGEVKRVDKNRRHRMTLTINPDGYLTVKLCKNGIQSRRFAHRLVAEAFLDKPDECTEVNHKDEDKTNNWVTNIEWCTHKYNLNYGTYRERKIASQKKPIVQMTLDGKEIARYPGIIDAAKALNKRRGDANIIDALKKKTRHAYGFRWEYLDKESFK